MKLNTPRELLSAVCCLLLLLLSGTPGCGFQQPSVNLKDVRLVGLDHSTVDVEGILEIRNPNDLGAQFSGYRYELEVEGHRLASEESLRPFQIPPLGTATLTIPARMAWDGLWAVARQGVTGRDLVYLLKGTVLLDTPFGKVPIPFSHQGTFNLIELLKERSRRFLQGL